MPSWDLKNFEYHLERRRNLKPACMADLAVSKPLTAEAYERYSQSVVDNHWADFESDWKGDWRSYLSDSMTGTSVLGSERERFVTCFHLRCKNPRRPHHGLSPLPGDRRLEMKSYLHRRVREAGKSIRWKKPGWGMELARGIKIRLRQPGSWMESESDPGILGGEGFTPSRLGAAFLIDFMERKKWSWKRAVFPEDGGIVSDKAEKRFDLSRGGIARRLAAVPRFIKALAIHSPEERPREELFVNTLKGPEDLFDFVDLLQECAELHHVIDLAGAVGNNSVNLISDMVVERESALRGAFQSLATEGKATVSMMTRGFSPGFMRPPLSGRESELWRVHLWSEGGLGEMNNDIHLPVEGLSDRARAVLQEILKLISHHGYDAVFEGVLNGELPFSSESADGKIGVFPANSGGGCAEILFAFSRGKTGSNSHGNILRAVREITIRCRDTTKEIFIFTDIWDEKTVSESRGDFDAWAKGAAKRITHLLAAGTGKTKVSVVDQH